MVNVSKKLVENWIPAREKDSYKGDYGHVLILAGSRNLAGAAVLCSWGALRGGAGLVTVGISASLQPSLLRWIRPEAMTLSLPETKDGIFSPKSIPIILDFVRKRRVTSLALGPGISRHPKAVKFVKNLLQYLEQTPSQIRGIVLDADGFLALKPLTKSPSILEKLNLPIIVTPHTGEMAKFLGTSSDSIEKERVPTAQKFAKLTHAITVLKGYRTVTTDSKKVYINTTGTPGMARGGSGDVLTGLIAALIGQILGEDLLLKSAVLGVYLHGLAGEIAQKSKTEISMLSGEIADELPQAFKYLSRPSYRRKPVSSLIWSQNSGFSGFKPE